MAAGCWDLPFRVLFPTACAGSDLAAVGSRPVGLICVPATSGLVGLGAGSALCHIRVVAVWEYTAKAVPVAEVLQLPVLALPSAEVEGDELRLRPRK